HIGLYRPCRRPSRLEICPGTRPGSGTGSATALPGGPGRHPQRHPIATLKESIMSAIYTFDVFSTLDGYGSPGTPEWGGYWGKQGPELLARRLSLYEAEQRMVFGASTYRVFAQLLAPAFAESGRDPWVARMMDLRTAVVSH